MTIHIYASGEIFSRCIKQRRFWARSHKVQTKMCMLMLLNMYVVTSNKDRPMKLRAMKYMYTTIVHVY